MKTKATRTETVTEIKASIVTESDIHKLVSSMYDFQHTRIIVSNRFHGTDNNQLIAFVEGLESVEQNMKLLIKNEVKKYPIHEWIISQRGLSYDLAGQIIGVIQDISKFDNVSKLWAYFGLAVVDVCEDCGKRWYALNEKPSKIIHIASRLKEQNEKKIVPDDISEFTTSAASMLCNCEAPHIKRTSQRMIKGALIDYNPKAKMLAYKIGVQFVKQGALYRELYDQFKAEYMLREDLKNEADAKKGKKIKAKNGETSETKGTAHIHNMAQRKVVKIFLQHLWLAWRKQDGLSISNPYVIDRMGHSSYISSEKGEVMK